MYLIVLVTCWVSCAHSIATQPPVWLTSQYFRAGNEKIINSLTGSNQTPEYTFVFSSPLPGVPYLAYGIKNYRGNDYFGRQTFQIRRVDLTASTYKVAVQIFGPTNIWMMGVSYIAIDPTFPHRLNSFDGVPLNYSAGNLVNVTTMNPSQILYYSNTINYTVQAAGTNYDRFVKPLSDNKILLYMMALDIGCINEADTPGTVWYPITLAVNVEVLSPTTYKLSLQLSYDVYIYMLHFSLIFYDQADVESSKKYFIMTEKVDFPVEGGFYAIPQQFVDNFIMGLVDFSTFRGKSVLHYNWEFATLNGQFGINVEYSLPNSWQTLGTSALTRQGTMVFYMKTWQCPVGFEYFNLTTNLCQDVCGMYNFENTTSYRCQVCSYSCADCTSGLDCLECSAADNRYLSNFKSCQCLPGYYEDGVNTTCQSCSSIISNCTDCFYNTSYQATDAGTGALQSGCFQCEAGYFLINNQCDPPVTCAVGSMPDPDSNACISCPSGCTACSSQTVCAACNNALNYFLNGTQCVLCNYLQGCSLCSSLNSCQTCKSGFTLVAGVCKCAANEYYDKYADSCESCSVTCISCSGPSAYECLACNTSEHRIPIGGSCACDPFNYVEPSDASTVCVRIDDTLCDRGFVYVAMAGQCKDICGDGINLDVECDDGNIANGDGCSDNCQIEQSFTCMEATPTSPSVCRLDGEISIEESTIRKSEDSNQLFFSLKVSLRTDALGNYDLTNILEFEGDWLKIENAYYDPQSGEIKIRASYSENIEGKRVQLQIKQNSFFNPDYPEFPNETFYNTDKATWNFSSQHLTITAGNNLQANYYDQQTYKQARTIGKVGLAFSALIGVVLCILLFVKNSISVLMNINSIQLSYLSLVAIVGQHPIVSGISTSLKPVLGYNEGSFGSSGEGLGVADRMKSMGFVENYLSNFNVMLLVELCILALMGFAYLAAHRKPTIKHGFKIMQREALLIIIFNLPNAIFSATLVREVSVSNFLFCSISLTTVVIQAMFLIKKGEQYLGFKEIFDFSSKGNYKKTIAVFFLSRVGICFSLAFVVVEPAKALIGAATFAAVFMIMMFYGRPFISTVNNILVMVCEVVSIGFYTIVYCSESVKPADQEYFVRAMIYMIALMVGITLCSLGYSIYYEVSNRGAKARVYNQLQAAKQIIKPNLIS